jgi:LruC domain-containing protein
MNLAQLRIGAGLLLSALAFSLSLQSCSKEDAPGLPNSSAATTIQSDFASLQGGTTALSCSQSVCLVAGQKTYVGTVGTGLDGAGNLLITYKSSVPIAEVHADVFTTLAAFEAANKTHNGNPAPGQFAYQKSFSGGVSTYTITVPAAVVSSLPDQFNVAAHAALTNGETAWGGVCTQTQGGATLASAGAFPGKNWATYFGFDKKQCAQDISFTYAWEDLVNQYNDLDYNDLVVQSKVLYTNTPNAKKLDLTFIASARGASFDHKFKFRIPKAGVVSVAGATAVDGLDGYYYVTVFESTKAVLPGTATNVTANTVATEPYRTPVAKTVTILLTNAYVYNSAKPYEPFITVYTSGDVNVSNADSPVYDLYIKEVTNRPGMDTFVYTADGKTYPNGIIIPANWRWPSEMQIISGPYPTCLTTSFGPFWYNVKSPNYLALTYSPGSSQ